MSLYSVDPVSGLARRIFTLKETYAGLTHGPNNLLHAMREKDGKSEFSSIDPVIGSAKVVATASMAGPADAMAWDGTKFWMIERTAGRLFSFDASFGAESMVGTTNPKLSAVTALAKEGARIYAVDSGKLHAVGASDAATSEVGTLSVANVHGMSVADGVLYAVAGGVLYTVDKTTAEMEAVSGRPLGLPEGVAMSGLSISDDLPDVPGKMGDISVDPPLRSGFGYGWAPPPSMGGGRFVRWSFSLQWRFGAGGAFDAERSSSQDSFEAGELSDSWATPLLLHAISGGTSVRVQYRMRGRAVTDQGNGEWSEWTSPFDLYDLPGVATEFAVATIGDGRLYVHWNDDDPPNQPGVVTGHGTIESATIHLLDVTTGASREIVLTAADLVSGKAAVMAEIGNPGMGGESFQYFDGDASDANASHPIVMRYQRTVPARELAKGDAPQPSWGDWRWAGPVKDWRQLATAPAGREFAFAGRAGRFQPTGNLPDDAWGYDSPASVGGVEYRGTPAVSRTGSQLSEDAPFLHRWSRSAPDPAPAKGSRAGLGDWNYDGVADQWMAYSWHDAANSRFVEYRTRSSDSADRPTGDLPDNQWPYDFNNYQVGSSEYWAPSTGDIPSVSVLSEARPYRHCWKRFIPGTTPSSGTAHASSWGNWQYVGLIGIWDLDRMGRSPNYPSGSGTSAQTIQGAYSAPQRDAATGTNDFIFSPRATAERPTSDLPKSTWSWSGGASTFYATRSPRDYSHTFYRGLVNYLGSQGGSGSLSSPSPSPDAPYIHRWSRRTLFARTTGELPGKSEWHWDGVVRNTPTYDLGMDGVDGSGVEYAFVARDSRAKPATGLPLDTWNYDEPQAVRGGTGRAKCPIVLDPRISGEWLDDDTAHVVGDLVSSHVYAVQVSLRNQAGEGPRTRAIRARPDSCNPLLVAEGHGLPRAPLFVKSRRTISNPRMSSELALLNSRVQPCFEVGLDADLDGDSFFDPTDGVEIELAPSRSFDAAFHPGGGALISADSFGSGAAGQLVREACYVDLKAEAAAPVPYSFWAVFGGMSMVLGRARAYHDREDGSRVYSAWTVSDRAVSLERPTFPAPLAVGLSESDEAGKLELVFRQAVTDLRFLPAPAMYVVRLRSGSLSPTPRTFLASRASLDGDDLTLVLDGAEMGKVYSASVSVIPDSSHGGFFAESEPSNEVHVNTDGNSFEVDGAEVVTGEEVFPPSATGRRPSSAADLREFPGAERGLPGFRVANAGIERMDVTLYAGGAETGVASREGTNVRSLSWDGGSLPHGVQLHRVRAADRSVQTLEGGWVVQQRAGCSVPDALSSRAARLGVRGSGKRRLLHAALPALRPANHLGEGSDSDGGRGSGGSGEPGAGPRERSLSPRGAGDPDREGVRGSGLGLFGSFRVPVRIRGLFGRPPLRHCGEPASPSFRRRLDDD